MITAEQRIKELTTRQVYYGSSLVVNLNAVKGKFYYKVYAWLNQGKTDSKILVLHDKYNGEDPEFLFTKAQHELNTTLKLGVPKNG